MKKQVILIFLFLLSLHCAAVAQQRTQHLKQPVLQLSHNKTSSIVFPFAIRSVDRGSADILAQVPQEAQNVLQVKAAGKGFPETNLTVITADGRLYSFPVCYTAQPAVTVIQVAETQIKPSPVQLTGATLNASQLQVICSQLETDSRFYYGIRGKAGGVKATLQGIYVYGNMLFFRVLLTNRSPLAYQPDMLRLSIRDRRQLKRTATQEEEVFPVYIHGWPEAGIASGHGKVLTIALENTSLPKGKKLVMDLFEKQNGPQLKLQVRQRHILKAPPLLLDTIF